MEVGSVKEMRSAFASALIVPRPRSIDERSTLLPTKIVDNTIEPDVLPEVNEQPSEDLPNYPPSLYHLMFATMAMATAYSGVNAVLPLLFVGDQFKLPTNVSIAGTAAWSIVVQAAGPLFSTAAERFSTIFAVQRAAYVVWFVGCVITIAVVMPVVTMIVAPTLTPSAPVLAIASVGLFLQAMGFGVVNTLQSIFVGDQFHSTQTTQLRRSFAILYFCFNVGELCGELVAPVLRQTSGFVVAFMFCTCASGLALAAFWSGAPGYTIKRRALPPPRVNRRHRRREKRRDNDDDDDDDVGADDDDDDDDPDEQSASVCVSWRRDLSDMQNIVSLYFVFVIYWSLYTQHNSTWVFQGNSMNRRIFANVLMPADAMAAVEDVSGEQIQCASEYVVSVHAVLVSLFLIDRVLEPAMAACNVHFRSLRKIGVGLLLCTLSFVAAWMLQSSIDSNTEPISIAWQLPQVESVGGGAGGCA
jgi:dipeptide/tripeptide permease